MKNKTNLIIIVTTMATLSGIVNAQTNGDMNGTLGSTPTGWTVNTHATLASSSIYNNFDVSDTTTNPSFQPNSGTFAVGHAQLGTQLGISTSMSQVITGLETGQQYTLTFDQAMGSHISGTGEGRWGFYWGGSPIVYSTTMTSADGTWSQDSVVLTALAPTQTLTIAASALPDVFSVTAQLGIDSLTIQPVPEPSSVTLLGLGTLGLLVRRKR